MRWVYLILALIGVGYIFKLYAPKVATTVFYTVPGINFGLTWGMAVVAVLLGLGAAKLKFGK